MVIGRRRLNVAPAQVGHPYRQLLRVENDGSLDSSSAAFNVVAGVFAVFVRVVITATVNRASVSHLDFSSGVLSDAPLPTFPNNHSVAPLGRNNESVIDRLTIGRTDLTTS